MTLDGNWSSAELARGLCDILVKKGHLKEKPAFIRSDREAKIVGIFEAIGLDGQKMNSFDNPGPLEMMVRKGTNGEAWVNQVIDALVSMLPQEAATARKQMGMDDETKAQLEAAKEKTAQWRDRLQEEAGGAGGEVDREKEMLEQQGKYYKQGEGPPLEELGDAWIALFLYGETPSGQQIRCSLVGGDGYFETARCAVEMAMTMHFDRDKIPHKGGVLTAGVAGQQCYLKRLIDSGAKFKMGEWFGPEDMRPPETNKAWAKVAGGGAEGTRPEAKKATIGQFQWRPA